MFTIIIRHPVKISFYTFLTACHITSFNSLEQCFFQFYRIIVLESDSFLFFFLLIKFLHAFILTNSSIYIFCIFKHRICPFWRNFINSLYLELNLTCLLIIILSFCFFVKFLCMYSFYKRFTLHSILYVFSIFVNYC